MTVDFDFDALEATRLVVSHDGIAYITMHRPSASNARNQRMRRELMSIYSFLAAASDVKVVVLTGAGDRAFCAGMDLKESISESAVERRERLRSSRDIEALANLPQATIAAINGAAMGGGCEMAVACDLRVMADDAVIGLTELDHGLVPGGGGTQRLPRLIGVANTYELLYLGRRLSGSEALAMGLVNRTVPRAELASTVHDMAKQISAKSALALRYAKELIRRSAEVPVSAGSDLELDALLALMQRRSMDSKIEDLDISESHFNQTQD